MAKIDELLSAKPLEALMAMTDAELEEYFADVLSLEPKVLGIALFASTKKPKTKADLKSAIQQMMDEEEE